MKLSFKFKKFLTFNHTILSFNDPKTESFCHLQMLSIWEKANIFVVWYWVYKAFANDKINVTEKLKIVFGWVENIVGKRRKCWFPAFSPFPTIFSKVWIAWKRVNLNLYISRWQPASEPADHRYVGEMKPIAKFGHYGKDNIESESVTMNQLKEKWGLQ